MPLDTLLAAPAIPPTTYPPAATPDATSTPPPATMPATGAATAPTVALFSPPRNVGGGFGGFFFPAADHAGRLHPATR